MSTPSAWFAPQSFAGRAAEPPTPPSPTPGTCPSCHGRGHVVDRPRADGGWDHGVQVGCAVCGFGPSSAPATLIAGRTAPAPDGAIVLYAGRREVARVRTAGELSAALREHFGARAQLDGWYERAAILVPLPVGAVSAEVAA